MGNLLVIPNPVTFWLQQSLYFVGPFTIYASSTSTLKFLLIYFGTRSRIYLKAYNKTTYYAAGYDSTGLRAYYLFLLSFHFANRVTRCLLSTELQGKVHNFPYNVNKSLRKLKSKVKFRLQDSIQYTQFERLTSTIISV